MKVKKEATVFLVISVGVVTILELYIWKMSWDILHAPRPQEADIYVIPLMLLVTFGICLWLLKLLLRIYRNASR